MLQWLLKQALGNLAEDALIDQYWQDHENVIIEAYDRARAEGRTEHEALEIATRRGLEHAI